MNDLQRSLFSFDDVKFTLYESPTRPQWRSPQRGALGALMAHWSLPRAAPALISLPTGSGKSAIALAAPFVHRVQAWQSLQQYEVVVAAPGTISPVYYPVSPPPVDLFDLVVIDEAHHSPAHTWRAILEHFTAAKTLLLTATPRRLDGQRLPGEHIYHYPLRQALDEHIFKPVQPILLSGSWTAREDTDRALVAKTVDIVTSTEHATSTLMVRAASHQRAVELAELYREAGIAIEALHSGLGPRHQSQIVDDLRAGRLRAVAVVGMLVEGFDLPSLRILAYHDKHKSLPATAQIIGRLARVNDAYPQPSVLIAARDIDVFPELHGVVRTLYGEDPDWATILPGIIDDHVAADLANHNYARQFGDAPPDLSLDAVQPLRRAVIHELTARRSKEPRAFEDGVLPEALTAGKTLRGKNILYSSLNPAGTTLMIVTESNERPNWHAAPGLDTPGYQLHLVSRRSAPRTDRRDLLIVNVEDKWVGREILEQIGVRNQHDLADPAQLEAVFDSLERRSVSSVGLRNDYGGTTGTTSYRMYHGKGVDRGLREADTAYGSLGHAMIQVDDDGTSFTAGVATAKSKYWETRYSPLLDYEAFVDDLAERYWFPPSQASFCPRSTAAGDSPTGRPPCPSPSNSTPP